jgi:hypothetical protein
MPDTPTPNYAMNIALPDDSMAQFETWFNANWDKITDVPAPPSGAALPQVGTYNLGDRFYLTTTQSIYILVCKDVDWGWHWRPIQDGISPWLTIPATVLSGAGWTINPVVADPLAIAIDHRGHVYWRGVIGTTPGNIARFTNHNPIKTIPFGLRPREDSAFQLGVEPLAIAGTTTQAWQGARMYIPGSGAAVLSIRTSGGTADPNRIWLGGNVNYAAGTAQYTTQ